MALHCFVSVWTRWKFWLYGCSMLFKTRWAASSVWFPWREIKDRAIGVPIPLRVLVVRLFAVYNKEEESRGILFKCFVSFQRTEPGPWMSHMISSWIRNLNFGTLNSEEWRPGIFKWIRDFSPREQGMKIYQDNTHLPINLSHIFVPFFKQNVMTFFFAGVDVEFWAHEHSYERLFPVYNHKVISKNVSNARGIKMHFILSQCL